MKTLNIIVFDDNKKRRNEMIAVIQRSRPGGGVTAFEKAEEMLKYVEQNLPEVAFISMENTDGRGYFLTKQVRKLSPRTNVVAVASEYRYAQQLMKLRISGYVTGEFTEERVSEEIANLRYPYEICDTEPAYRFC